MSDRYLYRFSEAENLAQLTSGFMTSLLTERDGLVENLVTGQYAIDHEANGGWRRLMAISNLVFPASGATTIVLDDSEDYRDRLLWFSGPIDLRADTILYPGHPDDGYFNVAPTLFLDGRVYYTRSGYAEPAVTGIGYWHFRGSEEILVYADSGTGALKMTLIGGGAGTGQLATLGLLYVSPKMNEYGTVAADLALFDASAGAPVEPHDLNNLQDNQHMDQLRGGVSLPLGPVLEGDPPLSRLWTVRDVSTKQRITNPQLRRYVSFECASGETRILDRAFDWRDRVLHVHAAFSATVERRPGQAGDTLAGTFAAADTDPTILNGYTGPGADGTGGVLGPLYFDITNAATPGFLYADEDTGYLMYSMVGEGGHIETFNGLVLASPQLGPRSGMTSPRLFSDPTLGKVGTLIGDSVDTDLAGIVARYRMDRGIAKDSGRVAGIADQSGNGYHLVQYDPTKRAFPPTARAALNGQLAIELEGSQYYDSVKALPASTNGYYIGLVLEPDVANVTLNPFEQVLALVSEGEVFTRVANADVAALWEPNDTATPDYEVEDTSGNYAAAALVGIAWMWDVDGGDSARLLPEVAVRDSLGTSTGSLVATSPAGIGAADVQSTLWRMLDGIDGHVAEIVICDAAQTTVSDFLTSADVVTRYGF